MYYVEDLKTNQLVFGSHDESECIGFSKKYENPTFIIYIMM